MSILAYWLSNYMFDIFRACVLSACTIGLVHYFNVKLEIIWVLLLEYPFALVPFTYCTSFFFKKESTAQNFTMFLHLAISAVGAIGVFMLRMVQETE